MGVINVSLIDRISCTFSSLPFPLTGPMRSGAGFAIYVQIGVLIKKFVHRFMQ